MCHRFLIDRNSPSVITSGAMHIYQERGKQHAIKRTHASALNLCPFYHQVSLLKPPGKAPEAPRRYSRVTRAISRGIIPRTPTAVRDIWSGARETCPSYTRDPLTPVRILNHFNISERDTRCTAMARSDLSGMRPITFTPRAYL